MKKYHTCVSCDQTFRCQNPAACVICTEPENDWGYVCPMCTELMRFIEEAEQEDENQKENTDDKPETIM